jgi:hypothetical protein
VISEVKCGIMEYFLIPERSKMLRYSRAGWVRAAHMDKKIFID